MSASVSSGATIDFQRVEQFKKDLVAFATDGPLRQEYELQRALFVQAAQPGDEHEAESVLDWFLFDWFDDQGHGVIDHFLDAKTELEEADREILLDWLDSINSVFEVRSAGKRSFKLAELDSGEEYTVKTHSDRAPFKRGQFLIARLLPLGDDLIFSGLQFVMPDRNSALAWLEMRRAFDAFDSPEAIEKARIEQCTAFCDLFGCDELTVASNKLNSTLARFQRYLLTERRDPETGLTAAERFRKELGQELIVPELPPIPPPVAGAGEVTILCDDFDGIVLLPDFDRFKRIFRTDEPSRAMPDWKDLVWTYIKNPDIPIVAFERVAEQYPRRVEKVMRTLIGDKDFSLEHLYAVLLHYKQPVDGLEDLKDDQILWDLFDGNGSVKSTAGKRKAAAGSTSQKRTRGRAAAKDSAAKKTKPGRRANLKTAAKQTSAAKLKRAEVSRATKRAGRSTKSSSRKKSSKR